MTKMRQETDSLGTVSLPAAALYGPQTARAAENFPISGWALPQEFIAAVALVKQAAAQTHRQAGRLEDNIAGAIINAAQEVASGKWTDQFPVDVFQTGSGTSTNMNANEVIARRATQILEESNRATTIHPNDHVNMGQSSNDVIPTALHISAALAIQEELVPALQRLFNSLSSKAAQFDTIMKIGRTHLMDAVPVKLGQEFAGWAGQIEASLRMISSCKESLYELAIGGTAVGTGLNAPKGFSAQICEKVAEATGLPFHPPGNHFTQQGARDAVVFVSGTLRAVALVLGKIASDIRLLGSGPRCGLGELLLPALQPGSSIMPGKINPVICESVIQVACQVVGCDTAIASGATGGVGGLLELNVAMPMITWNLLTAIRLLTNAAKTFADKCIADIKANEDRCRELVEQSLAMVTALTPRIGYDAAAEIAKEAYATGKTIRQICSDRQVLSPDDLDSVLDARRQTGD